MEGFDLKAAAEHLESLGAPARLRWAAETFGKRAVILGSMQRTSSVLIDLSARLGLEFDVLFVDTGFHFRETLRLRDEIIRRYRVNVVTLYPDATPEQQEARHGRKLHLFADGQGECCRLRKEEPFLNHCRQEGIRLVLNGARRGEGGRRLRLKPLLADPRVGGYTLHPIVDWTEEAVAAHLAEHDVPVHPLHAQGYPSIGCQCCTTPVEPGEDERAGRWRHLRPANGEPMYCGINFHDGGGI